jgi:TonB dependent receptor
MRPPTRISLALALALAALAQRSHVHAQGASEPAPGVRLDPVEVRGAPFRSQGSVTRLGGAEAASVPGAGGDPIRALQSLPGVISPNDVSSEPAVRGSRPGDNAYYVDFLPVGYLFHIGGLISVLPGELVQSFDLYSAAFGPQFADVTGAVLDVQLRKPRTDRLGGLLDASLLSAGVLVEGPLGEGHSFFLSGRRSYIDLLVTKPVQDEDSGASFRIPRYSDYQFKYLWQLNPRHTLSVNANGASDRLEFSVPGSSTIAQQQPALAGDGLADTSYATQALQWQADAGESVRNRLALGRTVTKVTQLVGSGVDVGVRNESTFLREELRFKPAPEHEVWLGGTVQRNRLDLDLDLLNPLCTEFDPDCDFSSAQRARVTRTLNANRHDVSLRDRWQLLRSWALTTGVRHSADRYLEQTYTEPRLGLEWAASESTVLSAGWGRHNQQPEGEQILAGLGNPQLLHLRARHSVLGVAQTLPAGWNWRAEVYDKRIDNLVIADRALNYRNGGTGHAWGAEVLLRKEARGSGVSGWLSVSWARSVRRNSSTGESFPFEFDQPLNLSLVGRWQRSEAWSFGAKWTFHSGTLSTPIVGTRIDTTGRLRPVFGAINSERLPHYHRLDLRADRRFSERLSAYLEVINAYNRRNVSGYVYNADYSSRKAQTQLPLLPSLGVQWTY